MPLANCLRPFNQSDRLKLQPLINELSQAVGDDHLLGIQTELFEVLVKIVGNLPLSSGSGYFWPGSYNDFSLKLAALRLIFCVSASSSSRCLWLRKSLRHSF